MSSNPSGDRLRILPPSGRASKNVLPGETADLLLYRGDRLVGAVVNGRYWKVE